MATLPQCGHLLLSLPLSLRLHREALKQSATDPKTGIIDVGILTTGVSSSERMRRQMVAKELKALLQVCTVHDPVVWGGSQNV